MRFIFMIIRKNVFSTDFKLIIIDSLFYQGENMKRLVLIILLFVLMTGGTYAQNRTSLNIVCNQTGAQVYIDGKLAGYTTPNFSFLIGPGPRTITLKKTGYKDFVQNITITNQPYTLNVVLIPIGAVTPPPQTVQHTLTVNANVQGAQVLINNVQAGFTPFNAKMAPGSYSLLVRAAGYSDFSQNLVINGNTVINAVLQAVTVPIVLNMNISGAEIYLNGSLIGKASGTQFNTSVIPGTYSLIIRLPGYNEYNEQINVMPGSGYIANINLHYAMANYQFTIPAAILNPDMKGNPWSQIRLFIDGVAQKDFKGQLMPGNHSVRVITGAIQLDTIINVIAGRNYVFEIGANIIIK